MQKKAILNVNMHCEGCALKITGALKENPAIHDVNTDLHARKVTIIYEQEKTDVGTIKKTIEDLGYTFG